MREIGLEVAIVTLLFLYVLHVEKFGTLYHHRGCKSIAAFGRQLQTHLLSVCFCHHLATHPQMRPGSHQTLLACLLPHIYADSGCVFWTDQSPRLLDTFTGVVYWTTWSRDRLLKTDRLGRGNTTVFLSGQTSVEALRFVHDLRYRDTGSISTLGYTCRHCTVQFSSQICNACFLGLSARRNVTEIKQFRNSFETVLFQLKQKAKTAVNLSSCLANHSRYLLFMTLSIKLQSTNVETMCVYSFSKT